VKIIEFDWIFSGREGLLFIEELATTRNENVFEVNSIKICVEYLWRFYYKQLVKAVIIPYVIYFIIFVVYALYFYDGEKLYGFQANHILGSIVLLRSIFFLYF